MRIRQDRFRHLLIAAICSSIFFSWFSSQSDASEVEIANLVLNKTMTRIGNDFYEAFSDNWHPPKDLDISHIKIAEAPSARWGSLISVSVNDRSFSAPGYLPGQKTPKN